MAPLLPHLRDALGPVRALERGVKEKLADEGHACRLCAKTGDVTRHHLVPVSWFKQVRKRKGAVAPHNVPENVVPLCRACHSLVDDEHPDGERMRARRLARHRLRLTFSPDEAEHLEQRLGYGTAYEHYPLHPPARVS